MIIGGYNIVDFEGRKFVANQNITVDSSIVDKLKDTTKPCVVGNFELTSEEVNSFIAPCFSWHYIVSGSHTHIFSGFTISVTGDNTIMLNV